MIFLSAQPDDFYFTWQLEIQLLNFHKLGISAKDIHVLVGYTTKRGLRHYFKEFIERNKNRATFFAYADTRTKRKYLSSIRPHIIKKHFAKFNFLQHESIFYHDSDIIFRELPNIEKLINNEVWYVSDTRDYLNSKSIKRYIGDDGFNKMCNVVAVNPDLVCSQDDNCGGAQYLLKNVTARFWEKVEDDSENLYCFLEDRKSENEEHLPNETLISSKEGLQSWCADMWAIFWNAILFNKEVKIDPELEFCWPFDPIEKWHRVKILHYSGIISKNETTIFRKGNYVHYMPHYDTAALKSISSKTCSFPLITLINEQKKEFDNARLNLKDVSFLIPIRIDSASKKENLVMVVKYLNRYFDTNILIAESDSTPKVDRSMLPSNCKYFFIKDRNKLMHRTKINNYLIKKSQTPSICLYDADVVISIDQIFEAVSTLRNGDAKIVFPYDGTFISVDAIFKAMFNKILDPWLFQYNRGKLVEGTLRSYGGCVFIDSETYIKAGLENEYFASWGLEDMERVKRMKNLGYKQKRIKGPLYHLTHERNKNSNYSSSETRITYMREYFKICNMNGIELQQYVSTWPWKNLSKVL